MSNQFDETTERKAREDHAMIPDTKDVLALKWEYIAAWKAGRDSAKESLEILATAMEEISGKFGDTTQLGFDRQIDKKLAAETIAQVKARGDWPL